jgi:snRNA-activating protein complex subunit 3
MKLKDFFPPLLSEPCDRLEKDIDVDISTEDLEILPAHDEINQGIEKALEKWNEFEDANVQDVSSYTERLKELRRLIQQKFYREDVNDNEEEEYSNDNNVQLMDEDVRKHLIRKKRQRQESMNQVFDLIQSYEELKRNRLLLNVSLSLQAFLDKYPSSMLASKQAATSKNTRTWLNFEFARSHPTPVSLSIEDNQIEKKKDREEKELIIWVEVFHATREPSKTQSFLVLGSQVLTQLVDLIVCSFDQRLEHLEKHSKLLYIGGEFYMDGRRQGNIDYSKEIREWIETKATRRQDYKLQSNVTKKIEETKFCELKFELDAPCVYIHQGECEHLIRFRNVRLRHGLDSRDPQDFPIRLPNTNQRMIRHCLICRDFSAKFVCYGDRLAVMDPMFFCEKCYHTAHYDQNGHLLYSDFISFPYYQD